MKCYCYETENDFILCVENVNNKQHEKVVKHAWFEENNGKYLKIHSMSDVDNGVTNEDKENVKNNFANLGQSMFESMLNCDWENALLDFSCKCKENNVEYYIFGSVSDAVRGVKITPHDIDIVVHTKDFFKVKNLFFDYAVEPFIDKKDTFLVRYIGRLFFLGVMFDIVASDKMNLENHIYEKVSWNGYDLYIETLHNRYQLELNRKREDRIKAIEDFMNFT